MVLVERVLRLLLALVGYLLRKLGGHLQLGAGPTVASLYILVFLLVLVEAL